MPSKYGFSLKSERESEAAKNSEKIANLIQRVHPIIVDILSDIRTNFPNMGDISTEDVLNEPWTNRHWKLGAKCGDVVRNFQGVVVSLNGQNENGTYQLKIWCTYGVHEPKIFVPLKKAIETHTGLRVTGPEEKENYFPVPN